MFEAGIFTTALSTPPRKFSTEREHTLRFDSRVTHAYGVSKREIAVAEPLESAIAKDFASLPEVRHVLSEYVDGNLLLWIAIDNAGSYDVRSRVYDKELALMDGFPEINFDFNLIPAMDRNVRELASGAKIIFSRS